VVCRPIDKISHGFRQARTDDENAKGFLLTGKFVRDAKKRSALRANLTESIRRRPSKRAAFATEGSGNPGKIRTPICLTHHPANPPTPEEVVARAKKAKP
jgi:hypothetical protein